MAKTSVKRVRVDDFQAKSKEVFKVLHDHGEINGSRKSEGNLNKLKEEETEDSDTSRIPHSDIHELSNEKSENECTVSKESCKKQKSENELAVHECMFKGCGKSLESLDLLTQHMHNHTMEKENKSFCGRHEETQPETSKSQECQISAKCDDDNLSDCVDEGSDAESSISSECCSSQKRKKTEPAASDTQSSLDDANEDNGSSSDDEQQDTISSSVFKVDQRRQKTKEGKVSPSKRLSVHICPYENCDKFFSRPNRLAQHVRTHTGERPYICPSKDCSKSYTRQQHLKRHIEVSHQEEEMHEKLQCAMCDATLSNVYTLRKHVQRHHVGRKHECTVCGQSFAKQQQLQKHTYVHTNIKPFLCDHPDCAMRFLTLSKLKRHKLIHQKSRYACPQESCEQKFDVYQDMQHHIFLDHPKECDICGRPFKQVRSLKKHRLTHENTVEAYFCTYPACDKYYTQLNNLTTHIKEKHKQMNIYECGICDKRLSTKQKLLSHITTHNPDYERNYASKKPRKPRKDKGCSRLDYARLLSGYGGPDEEESMPQQSEVLAEDSIEANMSSNISSNLQNKVLTEAENESDRAMETEEI